MAELKKGVTFRRVYYYPFGMNMEGNWAKQIGPKNKYQYNGKELNDDFGLNWSDYGARFYDAAIGRWNGVDALAEIYYPYSPYSYVINNPISYTDPDGMSIIYGNSKKEKRQIKRDIRKARRNSKDFKDKWKKIKENYGGDKKDLKIELSSKSENSLVDLKIGDSLDGKNTNKNKDFLQYSSLGVDVSGGETFEFVFQDIQSVGVNELEPRRTTSVTSFIPSEFVGGWDKSGWVSLVNKGGASGHVVSSSAGKSSATVEAYQLGTPSGSNTVFFNSFSVPIYFTVKKGLFGYKWRNSSWSLDKPGPGVKIEPMRNKEYLKWSRKLKF